MCKENSLGQSEQSGKYGARFEFFSLKMFSLPQSNVVLKTFSPAPIRVSLQLSERPVQVRRHLSRRGRVPMAAVPTRLHVRQLPRRTRVRVSVSVGLRRPPLRLGHDAQRHAHHVHRFHHCRRRLPDHPAAYVSPAPLYTCSFLQIHKNSKFYLKKFLNIFLILEKFLKCFFKF